MWPIVLSFVLVLTVQYFVPFIVYSMFTLTAGLKPPVDKSPIMFILGIVISKLGITAAFVLIYLFTLPYFQIHWLVYAVLWWALFVSDEIGKAIGPKYTWKEAMAGSVSHTITIPLSVLIVTWLLK